MAKIRKVPSRQHILDQISVLAVEPFQEILADLLEARPDVDALKEFGKKSPDRWGQAVTMAGKLAGYKPDANLTVNNIYMRMPDMSDNELQMELERRLSDIGGKLIEGQVTKVTEPIEVSEQDKAGKE